MTLRTDLLELATAYTGIPGDQMTSIAADVDGVTVEWREFPPRGVSWPEPHRHSVRIPLDASPRGAELTTPTVYATCLRAHTARTGT